MTSIPEVMFFIKSNGSTIHGQYMQVYGFTDLIFTLSYMGKETVE